MKNDQRIKTQDGSRKKIVNPEEKPKLENDTICEVNDTNCEVESTM